MKYQINTTIFKDEGVINQEVQLLTEWCIEQIARDVINTRDLSVRQALIRLGWTPPADGATRPKTDFECIDELMDDPKGNTP